MKELTYVLFSEMNRSNYKQNELQKILNLRKQILCKNNLEISSGNIAIQSREKYK